MKGMSCFAVSRNIRWLAVVALINYALVDLSAASESGGRDIDRGTFWQITDVHVELAYDSKNGDTRHQCRRRLLDAGTNRPDGPYGDRHCDSPLLLANLSIQTMKSIQPRPDFILWTGDNGPHRPPGTYTLKSTLDSMKTVTDILNDTFSTTRVFPCLGNHDVFPKDFLKVGGSASFYEQVYEMWKQWIPEDQKDTFIKGGYYSASLLPQLDLIALNTVVLMSDNDAKGANGSDPDGQISWLNTRMMKAQQNGHKVIIIGHVPLGCSESSPLYINCFLHDAGNKGIQSVLQSSAGALSAAIMSHEHVDTFRLIYDKKDKPVAAMFIAPSVTPLRLKGLGAPAPSIRLYKFDTRTGIVDDFNQYHMNLTAANQHPAEMTSHNWTLEYSIKAAYHLTDLSASSMDSLRKRFTVPKSPEFVKYIEYHLSGEKHEYDVTTDFTKCWQLCGISQVDIATHNKCISQCPSPSPNWPWDSPPVTQPNDITTPSVNTTATTRPRHHPHPPRPPQHIPLYMKYVIIGMAGLLVVLLMIIVVLCLCKNPAYIRPRYVRVSSINE